VRRQDHAARKLLGHGMTQAKPRTPPTAEEKVDEGVKETFPASDPVSVVQPKNSAHDRKKRGEAQPIPPQPRKRSPDWLLEKK
jgi:hypothetical protein